MEKATNQDVKGVGLAKAVTPDNEPSFRGPDLFFPKSRGVHELIREVCPLRPDKVAIRFGDAALTYRELEDNSDRLAQFLLVQGVGRGSRIGVALERSPDVVVSLLAILKAGAAYVPLDLEFPKIRLEFMLEDAGVTYLITSRKWSGYFRCNAREIITEEALVEKSVDALHEWPAGPFTNDLAYILYTSGSTGNPKGVMIEHHSLLNILFCMLHMPGMAADDKMLALTTTTFDIAGAELFLPLLAGAEIFMVDRETARNGEALLNILVNERISIAQATPTTWKMILGAGWNGHLPLTAISGGEVMSRQLADKLCARCQAVFNMYGPTETTIYSTGTQVLTGQQVTIGRPLMNTQVYILDADARPVGDGETGEIFIGGEGVARGYVHQDLLTRERFIADPFSGTAGARIYRTGDLGRWTKDGNVLFLGRADQQIKIRGNRVEPGEIEHQLVNLEDIKEAVVLLREDRPDDQQLVAFVVPGHDDITRAHIAAWRQALRNALPDYMVPASFVLVSEMPLTVSGKIDKKALPGAPQMSSPYASLRQPETDTERLVAEVWREVLNLEDVDTGDDFFELGGHSLIALELMTVLEEKTGKRLPIASLFEAPTVEKLSKLLDGQSKPVFKSLVPIKPEGTKPPLYIVHGIGLSVMVFHSLAKNMDPDQPVYGIQAWGLDGDEEPLTTIEEMAGRYVSQVLEHNPRGPYLLAGYSMGGIIVFEMAKQLRQMGKDLRLLAMFDTYAGNTNPQDPWMSRVLFKLKMQPAKFVFIARYFLRHPGRAYKYQKLVLGRKLNDMLAAAGLTDKRKLIEGGGFREKIVELMAEAREQYHLTPTNDDAIELFRVEERPFFLYDSVYLGWMPYTKKGVHITEATGDHKTFLQPPNDKIFAGRLQRLIDDRVSGK